MTSPSESTSSKMTNNQLVAKIGERALYLADLGMDDLRSWFPEVTDTREQLIKYCKDQRYTRGQIINAILLEEFQTEFDKEIE